MTRTGGKMTVDLLGPISRHLAQIAENAFEEEQPEYAIESLKIAFQLGMYPTRDLFLATLAVIVSSPDLKERTSIAKQKKKEAEKAKRYNKFLFQDIEKQTIISAIELVNDLVQSCPNAIGRYLPPFHRGYDDKGRVIDREGSDAEAIEWPKEQRNWLRRSANSEGPSSPEDSRANSRNRSPAVIRNSIIALALQMLECNDVFTLLALNPAEVEDATKGIQRTGRNRRGEMSRDGDDEEATYAREIFLREKYDRPGTWILLSILCSFWDHDLDLCNTAGRRDGIFIRAPHLAKQVTGRDWREPTFSRSTRGNAGFNNDVLGDAMNLIKVGLLPSAESVSFKKGKSARDSKSLAACNLLRLFESMARLGMVDRQALIRGMSEIMERIDAFAFEKLGDANLLVNKSTFFARSAIQHLSYWQEDNASSPWDAEAEDLLSDCIGDKSAWEPQQDSFLKMLGKGLWLSHRIDWAAEEEIQFWRLIKGTPDYQPDTINGFLLQNTWQLHRCKTQIHPKKRNSSKTDPAKETENRMQSFAIASEIRRKTVDRMITYIQLQRAIIECFQQYFVKLYPDRAYLSQILAKAVALLAQNIESDSKVVEKCLKGMQKTYKQILEGEVLQGDNSDHVENKKRRRPDNDTEGEARASTVSSEKSFQFVAGWTQVEKKIKRYLFILEAVAFSIESPLRKRERDSLSSDLTDLTED
ncbi:uncharacterized protein FA14DRAFT_48512 [Meira miltonrushii]|uniref:Uncharacterized protein n=1 Tax=Meira miltonrushii TaxID=1280837 RepID=A0A316VEY8_9BASI|nr:uncharacterized protein FA14DRAFT_48512 [Meira miltonrushii]PWN35874.1 hypothetical protein FA14DRAFT_48512 [Meira miltonrushii]